MLRLVFISYISGFTPATFFSASLIVDSVIHFKKAYWERLILQGNNIVRLCGFQSVTECSQAGEIVLIQVYSVSSHLSSSCWEAANVVILTILVESLQFRMVKLHWKNSFLLRSWAVYIERIAFCYVPGLWEVEGWSLKMCSSYAAFKFIPRVLSFMFRI